MRAVALSKQDKIIISVIVGLVVVLLIVGSSIAWIINRTFSNPTPDELHVPPSQRNERAAQAPPSSSVGPSGVSGDEPAFESVSCVFEGIAHIDPGLSADIFSLFSRSEQSMTLDKDSSFVCNDDFGESAGSAAMETHFDSLGLFNGVGEGPGTITWTELPALSPRLGNDSGSTIVDEETQRELRQSKTHNEVELIFPSIVVWITILDGPYAGFNGKLVLDKWTQIYDNNNVIIGIEFDPTIFEMNPII